MKRRGLDCLMLSLALTLVVCVTNAQAEFEWSVLKNIMLPDTPRDVTVSFDGSTAYVLCDKSIEIVSMGEQRLIGSLPVGAGYSKIVITPQGEQLVLTGSDKKQVTVIDVAQVYDIPVGTSPIIGAASAPVTVVAFLDYQCPYCSKAYPLFDQILAKYPKDVKLVIKHYPLQFHKSAEAAAIAALAAARQNKYKELSALLMQNSSQLSDQAIRQSAQQSGLDMEKFDAAIKDPAIKDQIASDMREAGKVNVRGVPSIYINGRLVKGFSADTLSAMIEQQLKKKK